MTIAQELRYKINELWRALIFRHRIVGMRIDACNNNAEIDTYMGITLTAGLTSKPSLFRSACDIETNTFFSLDELLAQEK